MLKIVCTEDLPCAREAFSTLGDVLIRRDSDLTPADLADADLFAMRSGTRVDAALLAGSRVRFVGTATIGFDHFDTSWLDQAGIRWVTAPGCNANSVSEWLVAALLTLGRRGGFRLAGRTLGIIGHGNVGTRVEARARALGMRVLLNDPPRARATGNPSYLPLEQVLAGSDIVTLHVPLEKGGLDPTHHLADARFFARLKPGAIFVNAARGSIVDTPSLLEAMERGAVSRAVLDTWEGEPTYREDLLRRTDLGTAHIAGHSYEGKVMGTAKVYLEACRFLGAKPTWGPEAHLAAELPGHPSRLLRIGPSMDPERVVDEAVRAAYTIEADDAALRATLSIDEKARARGFRAFRKAYPIRREFAWFEMEGAKLATEARKMLGDLGFRIP
ncbi:MAG: 4-phosphoerythronate dehydrogenase [Verrucomicrobiia bacterium]